MDIKALLQPENIHLHLSPADKPDLIARLVAGLTADGTVTDADQCVAGVMAREAQCTTGVGGGIAIPHCKCQSVTRAALAAAVIPDGMDYDALDGAPVQLAFLIVTPAGADNEHMEVLARLSRLLLEPDFREKLLDAPDADAFLQVVDAAEEALRQEERAQARRRAAKAREAGAYSVLAVTACPTGIAHTYMAAQALEDKAEELGIALKVETNGASGVQNALTEEEIRSCKGILVAADRAVEVDRFDGRPVLQVPVSKAITSPAELLQRLDSGEVPVYHADVDTLPEENPEAKPGLLRAGYCHLMNGLYKILPLMVGAGVLGALSQYLPEAVGGQLYQIGMAANTMVWIVLSGYIAKSISDDPGLAVGLATGALVQMGASLMGWSMPGVVGSIVAGFVSGGVVRLLQWLLRGISPAFAAMKPMLLYPVLGLLLAGPLVLALNIPATFVFGGLYNLWQTLPLWAAGIIGLCMGGMMAADLGGPVNKIAYISGVLLLTAQHTNLMAAVLAAGMVPPLAAGLAARVCRSRFSARERAAAWSTMAMGLCFISEAAMPLLARDKHAVRSAYIAGGALSGCLSMLWGCGSPVPHGGIFVAPLMTRPLAWLAALALGTLVSTVLLALRLPKQQAPAAD